MPNFLNPIQQDFTKENFAFAIQQSMADEFEAAYRYKTLAALAPDEKTKAAFEDIAREEYVHAGEFLQLLENIAPELAEPFKEGRKEVVKMFKGDEQTDEKPVCFPVAKKKTIKVVK